jgi:hypothetical protein
MFKAQAAPGGSGVLRTRKEKRIVGTGALRNVACAASLLAVLAVAGVAGADQSPPAFPSYGAFVIGDGGTAAGTPVTFWGAQWWKLNTVSGGGAPPAFKGFAETIAAGGCGSFTTRPGNSSAPPAGPLPSTMLTLVTNGVTKSGSVISGTVVGIAVVATGDGYAPDPGHAGTGTILSYSPCTTGGNTGGGDTGGGDTGGGDGGPSL